MREDDRSGKGAAGVEGVCRVVGAEGVLSDTLRQGGRSGRNGGVGDGFGFFAGVSGPEKVFRIRLDGVAGV